MVKLYQALITIGNGLQSPFLLIIRLYWGASFISTGMGKWAHIEQVTHYFQSLMIPFAEFNAHMAALTECIGGACLLLGLASRLATIPLIITMVVAYLTAETNALMMIFTNPDLFTSRAPFLFLAASLIVFIFGPGYFSLDTLLEKSIFKQKQ